MICFLLIVFPKWLISCVFSIELFKEGFSLRLPQKMSLVVREE